MRGEPLSVLVRAAAGRLQAAGIPSPLLEAQLLAAHVLGASREEVVMRGGDQAPGGTADALGEAVARRLRGEPMAYIRGVKEFWSMPLAVSPAVMIPRPETELLVERCLRRLAGPAGMGTDARRMRAADVGTGSGAVACALARELPALEVLALDVSPAALRVARANAERLGLSARIRFARADLLSPARAGIFDAIAANLPYVRSGDIAALPAGVRDFEPAVALDGGPDGLALVRRLAGGGGTEALAAGGLLAMEVADDQAGEVLRMLEGSGAFAETGVDVDTAGLKRVVWGTKR